jgi:type VI protein secretion system component VasK
MQAIRSPGRQPIGEACVLGGAGVAADAQGRSADMGAQLRALYTSDYIRVWKSFLASNEVTPFRTRPEVSAHLEILADMRSPLLAVLFLTAESTAVPAAQAPQGGPGAESGVLTKVHAASPNDSVTGISRAFQPIRETVKAGNRDRLIDEPNRAYMNALSGMKLAMSRLESDRPGNPKPVPLPFALVVKNGSKTRRRVSASMPCPLSLTATITKSPGSTPGWALVYV